MSSRQLIEHCRALSRFSEEPGFTTRTFLSPPMRDVHAYLREWMERIGMTVWIDAVGNLRGRRGSVSGNAPALWIGSHLDTVPRAGAFDGILGVVMAIALAEEVPGLPLEVVGFSEEEGVRFGLPFIGSRAVIGTADAELLAQRDPAGVSVADAIRAYGLDPARLPEAELNGPALGYLEFHIEQGPVLESRDLSLAVVEAIAGLSRIWVEFHGHANHAGTTPMSLRQDALAGAAEWISAVENEGNTVDGLVATVGCIEAEPGAANVIAGRVRASLDVRHADDAVRKSAGARLLKLAGEIAARRGLTFTFDERLDQPACAMDPRLIARLEHALAVNGHPKMRMNSGAGHDAMIMAQRMPAVMLFLRSPHGLSHHPDENVLEPDVAAAFEVGRRFLAEIQS